MNKFYIYTLTDPRDNSIRYVGRTIDPKARLWAHINNMQSEGKAKSTWISELRSNGMLPVMSIIDEANGKDDCVEKETLWIVSYLNNGCDLLNSHMPKANNPNRLSKRPQQSPLDTQERKTVCTSVRLTQNQMDKLIRIANTLRVKPNVAIGRLIEAARIVESNKVMA